ncbi:MAG: DUF4337 domain-containing protein [Candidatus Acidiferrales bacterium]
MAEDMQELQENAEHAAHEPTLAPVTMTMAVFAVLVAATGLMGHRSHTEELLHQTKATDQWAYYQAKDIRRKNYELFIDELSVFTLQNAEQVDKVKEKYAKEIERYRDQEKDIQAEARAAESEVTTMQRRADRFDLGEVMLEAALVICSITLLTRKRAFWVFGLALGTAGFVIASTGFLVH